MELKHPCVGLVQDANWWGKTKELLVLEKVLEKMHDVYFYWAGDGQYSKKIIERFYLIRLVYSGFSSDCFLITNYTCRKCSFFRT